MLRNLPHWVQMVGLGAHLLLFLLPKGCFKLSRGRPPKRLQPSRRERRWPGWLFLAVSSGRKGTLGCQDHIAPSRGRSQAAVLHGLPSLVGNSFRPRQQRIWGIQAGPTRAFRPPSLKCLSSGVRAVVVRRKGGCSDREAQQAGPPVLGSRPGCSFPSAGML